MINEIINKEENSEKYNKNLLLAKERFDQIVNKTKEDFLEIFKTFLEESEIILYIEKDELKDILKQIDENKKKYVYEINLLNIQKSKMKRRRGKAKKINLESATENKEFINETIENSTIENAEDN